MKTGHKRWRTVLLFLMLTALLYGCGTRETLSSGKNGEKEYQRAETMVMVTTERLRYEEVYTEKVWNAAVDNRGTTFETVLLSQIHDFLRELKLMSIMAQEEKIVLNSREKEKVKEAAKEYM